MSPSPSESLPTLSTSGQHLMSVEAMKAVIWTGFGICFVGFCARSYIRLVCFRRFLPEDWIVLFALALQLASACVAQLRLDYVYTMEDVSNGRIAIPPTFLDDMPKALHSMVIHGVLSITGVHAVKLSFLLFFYRLGRKIPNYIIFWWFVTFVVVASYAISIALIEYRCMLSPLQILLTECVIPGEVSRQWTRLTVYCTIDAASDVLILCLPIIILWKVRLTMRKKLMLAGIFSLTLLTVAVTIIRGTIQAGKGSQDGPKTQNIGWAWFWLSIEFITAYIIACLVSFRILFVHNERSSVARAAAAEQNRFSPARPSNSKRSPSKSFLDTLLDTFHDWEGTTRNTDGWMLNNTLPSGRMSVDFMDYQTGTRGGGGGGGGGGGWPLPTDPENGGDWRPDSAKTLITSYGYDVREIHRPETARTVSASETERSRGGGAAF